MRDGLHDSVVPTPDSLWNNMLEMMMEGHSEITLSDLSFIATFHYRHENKKGNYRNKKGQRPVFGRLQDF